MTEMYVGLPSLFVFFLIFFPSEQYIRLLKIDKPLPLFPFLSLSFRRDAIHSNSALADPGRTGIVLDVSLTTVNVTFASLLGSRELSEYGQ